MSAIYGIINKEGKPVDPEQLQKMKQAMAHRAHDGSGEVICDNAAFGFCHLIVYPNQENEKLPFEDGDLLFTANAHLYNRDELINRLGTDAKQCATTPDSYLILMAFKKWGKDCVHYLDGKYVFVIWNIISQELFIAIDHIGFQNLYYCETPKYFSFSTEIQGLEKLSFGSKIFNPQTLIDKFKGGGNSQTTYNKSILRLPGGNYLRICSNQSYLKKYWLPGESVTYNFSRSDEWFECYYEKIFNSIEKRISDKKKIAISLSGGLDSSIIACILSKILKAKNQQLFAYSSVGPINAKPKYQDERWSINIIKNHCDNIKCNFLVADNYHPFNRSVEIFNVQEKIPDSSSFFDFAVLDQAKKENIDVIFYGYGGDQWASHSPAFLFLNLLYRGKVQQATSVMTNLLRHEGVKKFYKTELLGYLKTYRIRKKFFAESILTNKWDKPKFFAFPKSILFSYKDFFSQNLFCPAVSVYNCRSDFFQIQSALPLIDKNVLDFLASFPSELYLSDGLRRSQFRKMMAGVVPIEIVKRQGKQRYLPNYIVQLQTYQTYMLNKLKSFENEIIVNKFFEMEKIRNTGIPLDGLHYPLDKQLFQLAQVLISCDILKNLQEGGYIFE